jgi:hypothetical protein
MGQMGDHTHTPYGGGGLIFANIAHNITLHGEHFEVGKFATTFYVIPYDTNMCFNLLY